MKKQDFNFDLPDELIAQYPLPNRVDSRLLSFSRETGELSHHQFKSLIDFLNKGDVLVLNNSKVIPARLYGHKPSGGKVELLVERISYDNLFLAHIKTSKALKQGGIVNLDKGWVIEIKGRDDDLFICESNGSVHEMLNLVGHIPLPPYIARLDEDFDKNRYQTVYAKNTGSVAAPTAGLHFDEKLLEDIKNKGINIGRATLHVGAGTFRPVRSDDIKDHKMHAEFFTVTDELAFMVNSAKEEGRRVIAVGTTAVRSLESAAKDGRIEPCSRDTSIFIYPGYKFQICDGLITNFHLPESTLLMLVAAFIGYKETMNLYKTAVDCKYRFFSYGDATLLL